MKKLIFIVPIIILLVIGFVVTKVYINKGEEYNLNDKLEEEKTSNQVDSYEVYSYITDDVLKNSSESETTALFRTSYTPEYMIENSDVIALVTIITIDGASTEYSSMFGMTYGSMMINNTIFGNDIKEQVEEYIKPGGRISLEDWEKAQPQAANEKREYLRQQSGSEIDKQNTYLNIVLGNDIELEAGKTYLAYLNYSDTFQKYEIIGLGNGLREINIEKKTSVTYQNYDINSLKIKNNDTKEWEDLDTYIQENIEAYK